MAGLRSAQDHVKKNMWDVFGTASSQQNCRLSVLQNNIVWLGNLAQKYQANNNTVVVVSELNNESSSNLLIYLNATLTCNFMRGQSHLTARRCLLSLGWSPF